MFRSKYFMAIDQGTTGTKVLISDETLHIVAESYHPFQQHFPKPGWVEHDGNKIWESVCKGIDDLSDVVDLNQVAAIGITNQRETVLFWNKKTGECIGHGIVWQDRRTAEICDKLRETGVEPEIQKKTGLLLDPYFSGTKIQWALENREDVQLAFRARELAVGTVDSFLLFKLTGGAVHATEPSNASRTLLFPLEGKDFDPELLKTFKVPREILPQVQPSFGTFGVTKNMEHLRDGTPITGMIGDQQSALLGQGALEKGEAKCTMGTGAFLLLNIGEKPVLSHEKLLTTIAWEDADGKRTYALEGSVFNCGTVVQWIRDQMGFIKSSRDIESLARAAKSSEGVVLVPAFTGLGAPYWNPRAKGALLGVTRGTKPGNICYAALEALAFQNRDLVEAMEKDSQIKLSKLSLDGGVAANRLVLELHANILGVEILRPKVLEMTGLGALKAAALGVGAFTKISATQLESDYELRVAPPKAKSSDEKYSIWKRAVNAVMAFQD